MALQQRNPSALSRLIDGMTCPSVRPAAAATRRNLPHCFRKFLEIQSLCKLHENIHTKAEWTLWNHLACVTHSLIQDEHFRRPQCLITKNIRPETWFGSSTGANRWLAPLLLAASLWAVRTHVSRSHSGLSARWNWNEFCYAVVSMRSSAQEEDNIIEHAQCCPGKDIKKYPPLFRFLVKLSFTLRAAIDQSRS